MRSATRTTRAAIRIAASVGSIAVVLAGTTSLASAQPSTEVVAEGLDNPRHLTFSATGRVVPGEEPTVYASGLTNLTGLAFAEDGSLVRGRDRTDGLLVGPIGSLVKVIPGASVHETVVGGLSSPYGVALRSGAAYVSTCAVCVGGGEVIRVSLD